MEDSTDSDTDSDISLSDGSDISLHGSSDEEFSSDTDSDVESQTETQSSLCTLDSQLSDIIDDDFWSNELHNIEIAEFQEECGPCHELDPSDHVYRYFLLMFPLAIFGKIAEETNRYAEQRAENTGQPDPNWIPTNEDEVKAYFGLWILMGINQLPDIHMYWSDNKYIGNQGFKDCMTRNRFSKLSQYLHLNDNSTQGPAGSSHYDRLHKIRPLILTTRDAFKKHYKPGKCQSIDEGMVRYKGQHYARQYTPCKPIKRGLKVWMRCEPNGYTHDYRLYLGKYDDMRGQSLGERVVKHLCKAIKRKGHHVFFDRFFTSIPLVQCLETYGIYACGTIMSNRRGFPVNLKNPKLERGDAQQMQHGNVVVTVWNDNKPVHVLSTTSNPLGDGPAVRRVRGGGMVFIQRPPAIEHYQHNYCGVDRSQQYRSKNPVGRPSKKFWKYFMNFILEICLINSYLLWLNTPGTTKPSRHYSLSEFSLDVAQCLIGDFSSRKRKRCLHPCNPPVTPASIERHSSQKLDGNKRRCKWCSSLGVRRETVYGCSVCDVHLCKGACFQTYHVQNLLPHDL